jgi:hypothetical protein
MQQIIRCAKAVNIFGVVAIINFQSCKNLRLLYKVNVKI